MHCGNRPPGQTVPTLTPREHQLLDHIAQGCSNKVIAIDFGISTRTAEAHRARIYRKMGVRTALALACAVCPHRGAGGAGGRKSPPADVSGRPGPAA